MQSLLPVLDYTITMQACIHILLNLHISYHLFQVLCSPFNTVIQHISKSNNTCHSLQRSIHSLTSLLVEILKRGGRKKEAHESSWCWTFSLHCYVHCKPKLQPQNTKGRDFPQCGNFSLLFIDFSIYLNNSCNCNYCMKTVRQSQTTWAGSTK